jgi:hypothetical protein
VAEPEIRIKGDVGQYTDASYWIGDIEVADMEIHEHSEPIDEVVSLLPKFAAEKGIAARKARIYELARYSRENRTTGWACAGSIAAMTGVVQVGMSEFSPNARIGTATAGVALAAGSIVLGNIMSKRSARHNSPIISQLHNEIAIIEAAPKTDGES